MSDYVLLCAGNDDSTTAVELYMRLFRQTIEVAQAKQRRGRGQLPAHARFDTSNGRYLSEESKLDVVGEQTV